MTQLGADAPRIVYTHRFLGAAPAGASERAVKRPKRLAGAKRARSARERDPLLLRNACTASERVLSWALSPKRRCV
jgi:hypothetical protein